MNFTRSAPRCMPSAIGRPAAAPLRRSVSAAIRLHDASEEQLLAVAPTTALGVRLVAAYEAHLALLADPTRETAAPSVELVATAEVCGAAAVGPRGPWAKRLKSSTGRF